MRKLSIEQIGVFVRALFRVNYFHGIGIGNEIEETFHSRPQTWVEFPVMEICKKQNFVFFKQSNLMKKYFFCKSF